MALYRKLPLVWSLPGCSRDNYNYHPFLPPCHCQLWLGAVWPRTTYIVLSFPVCQTPALDGVPSAVVIWVRSHVSGLAPGTCCIVRSASDSPLMSTACSVNSHGVIAYTTSVEYGMAHDGASAEPSLTFCIALVICPAARPRKYYSQ